MDRLLILFISPFESESETAQRKSGIPTVGVEVAFTGGATGGVEAGAGFAADDFCLFLLRLFLFDFVNFALLIQFACIACFFV